MQYQQASEPSSRLKIVYMSGNQILSILNWKTRDHEYLSMPVIEGLPDGYRVRAIHDSFERGAFGLMIEHESFDEVPQGQCVPVLNPAATMTCEVVEVGRISPRRELSAV